VIDLLRALAASMRVELLRVIVAALLLMSAAYLLYLSFAYYNAQSIPRYRLESGWFVFAFLCAISVVTMGRGSSWEKATRNEALGTSSFVVGASVSTAAAFLLYWPTLSMGVLSDDYVLSAVAIGDRNWLGADWYFRPVPILLWRAFFAVGLGSMSLHVFNVALHAANAVLTAIIALRLGAPKRVAVGGAMLFLVFPASVEAVGWASGVQDVVLTTLGLLFVLAVGAFPNPPWTVTGLIAFGLALGTKESAVVLPVLAAVTYWRGPASHATRRRWTAIWVPLTGAAIFTVWRLTSAGDTGFMVPPSRYLFQRMLSLTYGSLGVPWHGDELVEAPSFAFLWVTGITVAILVSALRALWSGATGTGAVRFALWIALAVAPVYSMFFVSPDLQGSRYLYLATPAWGILFASILDDLRFRNSKAPVLCALLVVGVVSAVGVRLHVKPWLQAATLRDSVLEDASRVLANTDCALVGFAGLPDSVDGAYVFRNGFHEALAAQTIRRDVEVAASVELAPVGCRYEWAGEAFEISMR